MKQKDRAPPPVDQELFGVMVRDYRNPPASGVNDYSTLSRAQAEAHAEQLALKNPGLRAYVMRSETVYRTAEPTEVARLSTKARKAQR